MSMHVTSNCVSKIVLTAQGKKRTTYQLKKLAKNDFSARTDEKLLI